MMPIERRSFLAASCLALLGLGRSAQAQGLTTIEEVVRAIGDATDVIEKFTDNLYKATRNGLKIWDIGRARYERSEYVKLARDLKLAYGPQNANVIQPLDNYIYDWQRRASLHYDGIYFEMLWSTIQAGVTKTLAYVQGLLNRLQSTNGLLPATSTYRDLLDTLSSRVSVLAVMNQLDAPSTKAEVDKLQMLDNKYKQLHQQLGKMTDALDGYIRAS